MSRSLLLFKHTFEHFFFLKQTKKKHTTSSLCPSFPTGSARFSALEKKSIHFRKKQRKTGCMHESGRVAGVSVRGAELISLSYSILQARRKPISLSPTCQQSRDDNKKKPHLGWDEGKSCKKMFKTLVPPQRLERAALTVRLLLWWLEERSASNKRRGVGWRSVGGRL